MWVNSGCAIAAWLECFQEKPSWCRNKQVWQGRKSVKRFERSNGLDTALYKNIPLFILELLQLLVTANKIMLNRILTLLVIGHERFRDGLTDSWKHIHTWKSESCTLGADYLCNFFLIRYKIMNKGRIIYYIACLWKHTYKMFYWNNVSTIINGDQPCYGLDNEQPKQMWPPELYIF